MYSAVKVIITVKVQYTIDIVIDDTDAADEKFTRFAIKITECMATWRDSATRFLTLGVFHESVSPKPLSIPLGTFQNIV